MERKHQPPVDPDAGRRPPATPGQDEAPDAQSERERAIDETIEESFPSSDPPSWTLGKGQSKKQ